MRPGLSGRGRDARIAPKLAVARYLAWIEDFHHLKVITQVRGTQTRMGTCCLFSCRNHQGFCRLATLEQPIQLFFGFDDVLSESLSFGLHLLLQHGCRRALI